MTDEFESSLFGLSATLSQQTSFLSTGSETETSLDMTKEEWEKRQLLHSIRLLKLELSQKNLVIDNLKAENASQIDDLKEKLSDVCHEKQILRLKLESAVVSHKTEAKRIQERTTKEIDALKAKQALIEAKKASIYQLDADLKSQLHLLDEEEHRELLARDPASLSFIQKTQLEVHRLCAPLKTECRQLRYQLEDNSAALRERESEMAKIQKELTEKAAALAELQMTANQWRLRAQELEGQMKEADYKETNYDRVKSERDDLDKNCTQLQHAHSLMEVSLKNATSDRDSSEEELARQLHVLGLLQQDKEYLSRQVQDLSSRAHLAEEKERQALSQLADAKRAREELYEKLIGIRENYKSDYEQRLSDEVERLRAKTSFEMDQLKISMKEIYERENRGLREARDLALANQEKASISHKEAESRADQLALEVRQLQLQLDSKTGELQTDLRLKCFETERAQLVLEDQSVGLKKINLENDKLKEKLDVLMKEFYSLQSSSERRIGELEAKCSQQKDRLALYEKLEKELDEVVIQAAEISDDAEAERVLFSYGYGANVPSTAKRRLQHSVHLARRVLQLERDNSLLKKDGSSQEERIAQLALQLDEGNRLLEQSQQPYNYLVDTIRTRDQQIGLQKRHLETLGEEARRLKNEKEALIKSKNALSADLERLLNQREEMAVMKKSLAGLVAHSSTPSTSRNLPSQPAPTIFTQREVPSWYQRLRQKQPGPKLRTK
eukprot:m.133244 g.133244  ORF g.133244 m.133244 type:complete len:729 (+) comp38121_c0_seq4:1182-3368(+)